MLFVRNLLASRHVGLAATCCIGVAVCAGFLPVAHADDLFEEVHVYHQEIDDPDWETTYQTTFDFAGFDTQGGERQFLGYEAEMTLGLDYHVDVADNPTADWVGAEASMSVAWLAELWGETLFPDEMGFDELVHSPGFGVVFGPFMQGDSLDMLDGSVTQWRTITSGEIMALLTTSPSFTVDSTFTFGPLDVQPVPEWMWPEGETVLFEPDLLQIDPLQIHLDLTVTYFYTPEPGTLGLLGLGALTLLRRR